MVSICGTSSRRSRTMVVATLYGRFATRCHCLSAGRTCPQSISSASPWTTRTPRGSTVSANTGSRCRSSSTATTFAPVAASSVVNEPTPGPISTTFEFASMHANRTMRRTVFGSARKFWPSARLGSRPWRASNSVMSRGESVMRSLRILRSCLQSQILRGYDKIRAIGNTPRTIRLA